VPRTGWPAARYGAPSLIGLLALLRFLAYRAFRPDDLYIYLQFVRNLLERHELAFNAGEPTYGFTSPLWLFVLGGATALLRDPFLAAKACSLVCSLLAPVLLYLLALRLTGERGLAFLAGLAFAWDAWLVRWSFAGLEGALSAALPLLALLLALRALERERFPWGAAILSGLAPLVRPEMIGWWILFAAWCAFAADRGRAGLAGAGPLARLGAGLRALLPGVVLWGGFAAFTLVRFGRVVPNTAQAKGAILPPLSAVLPSAARILKVVASTAGVEIAAVAAAAAVLARRGALKRLIRTRDPHAAGLMIAWSVGLVGLYSARGVTVYTRYLLMLLPFVVLGGFCAAAPWWRGGRARRAAVLLLAGAVLGQNLALDLRVIRPATRNYERSMQEVNVHLGEWLRDHTDPGAVVAVPDIGAIGYVSRRRILDLNGLVTPDLIPFKREGRVLDYLALERPDYVIDIDPDPDALPRKAGRLGLTKIESLPFHNMFISQPEPLYYSLYAVETGAREAPAGSS
jgi:hypothetical protein